MEGQCERADDTSACVRGRAVGSVLCVDVDSLASGLDQFEFVVILLELVG